MITRRSFLALTGGLTAAAAAGPARATPQAVEEALRRLTGGAHLVRGRVRLEVPALIENGNSVALSVAVDSPMTPEDHVRAVHVFAPENPLPNVISAYFGPRAGRARFATRVRVATSQALLAVAELSDGTFWSDRAEVVVTLPACAEES